MLILLSVVVSFIILFSVFILFIGVIVLDIRSDALLTVLSAIIFIISLFAGVLISNSISIKVLKNFPKTQEMVVVKELVQNDDGKYYEIVSNSGSLSYVYFFETEIDGNVYLDSDSRSFRTFLLESNERTPAVIEYKTTLDNKILSFLIVERIYSEITNDRTVIIVPKK